MGVNRIIIIDIFNQAIYTSVKHAVNCKEIVNEKTDYDCIWN